MQGLDIANHRKNKKQMRDCHDKFLRGAFESMINKMASNDTLQLDTINAHRPINVSNFVLNFQRLKTRQNEPSSFINSFHRMANT